MMTRGLAAGAAVLLLAAGCGNRSDDALPVPHKSTAAARHISLPDPAPATRAFLVTLERRLRGEDVRHLQRARNVAVVAPLALRKMAVKGPGGRHFLRVGSIDPLAYRPVAPHSTRDADFVWTSLLAGEAAITFDAAGKLGLDGRSVLGLGGDVSVPVGSFADNGSPNLVDVLVADRIGRTTGIGGANTAVIGARPGASLTAVRQALESLLPHARVQRLAPSTEPGSPATPPAPESVGHAEGGLIGTMAFRILKTGFIEPDPAWVVANIARGPVPILGTVTCHRILFPQLGAALHEIESRGLAHLINRREYGGCYVPRFVDRNPTKPLSMHAFGLAVDLNVSQNYLGTRGNMDPRIVGIFERWGFVWGGRWGRPDPMHFELARLVEV
jgi:hypothetical protein